MVRFFFLETRMDSHFIFLTMVGVCSVATTEERKQMAVKEALQEADSIDSSQFMPRGDP
jgi:hypothetical protein